MEPWDPEFLYFDDEEFPTIEATLRRLAQSHPNIHSIPEPTSLRETALILQPISVDGFPPKMLSSFRKLRCEMCIRQETRPIKLKLCDNNITLLPSKDDNVAIWELMEFYGPTKIFFKIIGKTWFSSTVICQKELNLSTFWSFKDAVSTSSQSFGQDLDGHGWASVYHFTLPIVSPKILEGKQLQHESEEHPSFLQSAKNASVLTATNPPKYYAKLTTRKQSQVTMSLRFRVVGLQSCVSLSDLSDVYNSENNMIRQSELHRIAMCGPDVVVGELMAILARNQSLRRSLALRDACDRNVFDRALLGQNLPVVRVLLERAGHLCFQGTAPLKRCAIHNAVHGGSEACLSILLKFLKRYWSSVHSGSDWNALYMDMLEWRDEMGYTPLAAACSALGNLAIVKRLVEEAVNVGCVSSVTKRTPLMLASQAGDFEVVAFLLSLKKTNLELFEEEIEAAAASPFLHDMGLLRARAAGGGGENAQEPEIRELKCRALERDDSGNSAVLLAAKGGHTAIVNALLDLGAPLLEATAGGDTLFHFAAAVGAEALCDALVRRERESWIRYTKQAAETSLLVNMRSRPQILLQRNLRGKNPADVARESGHTALAEKLKQYAGDIYQPHGAAAAAAEGGGVASAVVPTEAFGTTEAAGGPGERKGIVRRGWRILNDPEIEFDDGADEEEYSFAVAPKSTGSQSYYQIASIINKQEQRPQESAPTPAGSTESCAADASSIPLPAVPLDLAYIPTATLAASVSLTVAALIPGPSSVSDSPDQGAGGGIDSASGTLATPVASHPAPASISASSRNATVADTLLQSRKAAAAAMVKMDDEKSAEEMEAHGFSSTRDAGTAEQSDDVDGSVGDSHHMFRDSGEDPHPALLFVDGCRELTEAAVAPADLVQVDIFDGEKLSPELCTHLAHEPIREPAETIARLNKALGGPSNAESFLQSFRLSVAVPDLSLLSNPSTSCTASDVHSIEKSSLIQPQQHLTSIQIDASTPDAVTFDPSNQTSASTRDTTQKLTPRDDSHWS